jgi:hypothetical protein
MFSRRFTHGMVLALIAVLAMGLVPAHAVGAQAGGGLIAYGDTVTGRLDNTNYFELWQFSGSKGDHVQIVMVGDGQLDPYLGLLDAASQQVLAEDDDSAGGSDAALELTLPASGDYAIIATRYNFDVGTSQGKYRLTLTGGGGGGAQNVSNTTTSPSTSTEPVEIDTGVWYMGDIPLAESMSGAIDAQHYAQLYSLNVDAGTSLVIAMLADNSALDPYLMFINEAGDVLAEDDDSGAQIDGAGKTDAFISLKIPASGNYYVIATRAGVDSGKTSGDYVLLAAVPDSTSNPQAPVQEQPVSNSDLPPGVAAMGMIAVGDQGSGTISSDAYMHVWGFDGQAGQQVTITMRGAGGLDAYLGIIDPNNEVIAEDDDSGGGSDAQISLRLPESGTYVIVATRNGIDQGTTTGNYTLEVTDGTPQPPTGQTGIGGFGGLPGRAFPMDNGPTFFLRGTGASIDPAKSQAIEQFVTRSALPGRANPLDAVRGQFSLNFEEIKFK